jgi:hypothetical integral membrane protein (TIGR02206 family)
MDAVASSFASDTLHVFTPFGALHLPTVSVCVALLAALAWFGRDLRGSRGEPHARIALAVAGLAYWIAYNTWWNWHGIDLRTGLPLQACDVSGLVAPVALLTASRPLRAMLYFWAFGFATQAYIQPTLTAGPAYLLFWAFWGAHTLILAGAIYDLVVLGFRPDWRDYGRALLATLIWAAVVLSVDLCCVPTMASSAIPRPILRSPPRSRPSGHGRSD